MYSKCARTGVDVHACSSVCVSGYEGAHVRRVCVCVCVFLQRDRWEMDGERQRFLSHSIQLDRIY